MEHVVNLIKGGNGMEEIKTMKEIVLEKILSHRLKGFEGDTPAEKEVRELIDEKMDIWYPKNSSEDKPKPVLSKGAIKKLMNFTQAKVIEAEIHERQSDAPSQDREQVWIEITVEFPDGSRNSDDGIANRWNARDQISGGILPIMARKRGISRAFLQSDYIGLYDVYDENENEDFSQERNENAQLKQQVQNLYNQLEHGKKEFASLRNKVFMFARLSNEDEKYPNALVKDIWFQHKDKEYMTELMNSEDELIQYVAAVMIKTTIPNEERKAKRLQKKQEAEEQEQDSDKEKIS